jgi:hypothetical protein
LKTIDDHGFWSWSIISGLLGWLSPTSHQMMENMLQGCLLIPPNWFRQSSTRNKRKQTAKSTSTTSCEHGLSPFLLSNVNVPGGREFADNRKCYLDKSKRPFIVVSKAIICWIKNLPIFDVVKVESTQTRSGWIRSLQDPHLMKSWNTIIEDLWYSY